MPAIVLLSSGLRVLPTYHCCKETVSALKNLQFNKEECVNGYLRHKKVERVDVRVEVENFFLAKNTAALMERQIFYFHCSSMHLYKAASLLMFYCTTGRNFSTVSCPRGFYIIFS